MINKSMSHHKSKIELKLKKSNLSATPKLIVSITVILPPDIRKHILKT